MNKYQNYKGINIQWVKEIPSHWHICRISNIFGIRREKNKPIRTKEVLSLSARYGVSLYSDKKEKGGNKPKEDFSSYNLCYPGDILVNCMNIVSGAVGISKYFGAISPVYYPLVNLDKEKYDTRFMEYIFRNYNFQRGLVGIGKGIQMSEAEDGRLFTVRMRISWENLKVQMLIVPTIEEQEHIANYLDWKIGKIDKLIQIEKNKIKELEMYKLKEFNNIYKNLVTYKEIPLKRVGKIYSGKEIEDETKEGIPVYGSGKNIFKYTTKELLNGEYIIFGRKGTIGKPYKLSGKFWIVDTAYAIKNNDLVLLDYLYYLLRIFNWEDFLTNTVKPSIVANQILQVKMRIPSIEIQEKIVKNIYSLEEKIENTIKLSNKKISLLIELKNALISEVVTGQIDVRNVKIPESK